MSYAGEQVDPFDHCHGHEICFVIIDIVMITSSNNLFVQRSIEENKIGNDQLHTFNKPYRLMKHEELLTVDEYPPLENNGRMSVEGRLLLFVLVNDNCCCKVEMSDESVRSSSGS